MIEEGFIKIVILFNFLIVPSIEFNIFYLMKNIKQIKDIENIYCAVIFVNEENENKLLHKFYIHLEDLNISWMTITNISQSMSEIRHNLNEEMISVVFIESRYDNVLDLANKALYRIRKRKIIFVFNHSISSLTIISEYLYAAWKFHMLNVIAVFQETTNGIDNMFTYDPFPRFRLMNMTGKRPIDAYINENRTNFNGFVLKTLIKRDVPQVFEYKDQNGRTVITGVTGRAFMTFMNHINVIVQKYKADGFGINLDWDLTRQTIEYGKIEISMSPMVHFNRSVLGFSYPLTTVQWCMTVPVDKNIVPEFMCLIYPFDDYVWITIIASTIYMTVIIQKASVRFVKQLDIGETFLIVLRSILYLGFPKRFEKQQRLITRIIFFQLLLFGFIISNLYLGFMTSFLSRVVLDSPIDSVQDMIKANMKVLSCNTQMKNIFHLDNYPEQFKKLFIRKDVDTLIETREKLDTRYAYILSTNQWEFILKQQELRQRPLFRVSKLCFGTFHISYIMQIDSFFEKPLNNFILKIYENGLYKRWITTSFQEAVMLGLMNQLKDDESNIGKAMTMKHYILLFVALGIGYGLSLLTFIFECFKGKMKRKI